MNSLKFLWMLALLGLGILFAETATYALAQEATSPTAVDVSSITDSLIAIIGAVLSGLAVWIGVMVKAFIATKIDLSKTDLDEKLQQRYNEAALRGIAYAESILKQKAPDKVDVHSTFVKTAGDYVVQFWPDLVDRLGLTPENVRDTIISRLPTATAAKADELAVAKASGTVPTPSAS